MAGRRAENRDFYKERIKQLVAIKLQAPLAEDIQEFVKGLPDWVAPPKPVGTLLKAGRYGDAMEYLDREIRRYEWEMKPNKTKGDYLERLGFTRDEIGDPVDKERREAHRAKHDRTRRKLEDDPDKK